MGRKIVYHMEGWTPEQLIAFQDHHNRSGGDLEHCDENRKSENEQVHGTETWAEDFVAEVEFFSQLNMRHEAARAVERGRPGDAKKIRAAGPQAPWKASSELGVVRSVIVSADDSFFRQEGFEDFEGADFRDPKICEEFKQRAIEFMDSKVDRKYCLAMFWELDEQSPHLHAYYACWNVKDTKTKGIQRMLQPTDMKHFRNAEKAQTEIAEWFAPMGLDRGDDTAQQRRDAKAKGEVPPEKKKHVPPWLYRRQMRAEALTAANEAKVAEAKAKGRERAAREAEAEAKKAAEAGVAQKKKAAEERRKLEAERIENARILAEVRAAEEIKATERKEFEEAKAKVAADAADNARQRGLIKKAWDELKAISEPIYKMREHLEKMTGDQVIQRGLAKVKKLFNLDKQRSDKGFDLED
ncbi:hypothetical protein [Sagittula sp. MA-2]|jgi:hypothetical protein|uniref:hypothetical protein n=1 Tax=Sagittula sp. MA-2 TaxID=3048007 RepID=UPI0024C3AE62|nr:hypothetical protein [Sagittula sp. MA-2]WHZ36531.1 hypothetical protein QNI11_05835 [Sagittula sp. MA-2]